MEVRHLNHKMDDDRPENLRPVITYPDAEVTQEYLRKAFHLNYRTGELFRWIEVQGHRVLETKAAGCLGDSGRWEIFVLGQLIRRHRLVYLYVHGKMPEQISHKNGILTDDRTTNLRPVTISQRQMGKRGKLGRDLPKGVCQQSRGSKLFYARIKIGGKQYYLGSFETAEEAAEAYDGAAKNLFGEYARLNNGCL
jgi:hypothetical protein